MFKTNLDLSSVHLRMNNRFYINQSSVRSTATPCMPKRKNNANTPNTHIHINTKQTGAIKTLRRKPNEAVWVEVFISIYSIA